MDIDTRVTMNTGGNALSIKPQSPFGSWASGRRASDGTKVWLTERSAFFSSACARRTPFEKASFTTRRSQSNSASMNKVRALALLTLALLSSAAMEDLVWGAQPLRAKHAMVTSGETNATEAGLSVLKSGGNAMDAAVAIAFVLGVTHSGMCGLGGGGYALVRMADGRAAFFDLRERA